MLLDMELMLEKVKKVKNAKKTLNKYYILLSFQIIL